MPNRTNAVHLEAIDGCNLTAHKMSLVRVDATSPSAGRVMSVEGALDTSESACLGNIGVIYAAWDGFNDQESVIVGYEWCAGRVRYSCDLVLWTPVVGHMTRASANMPEDVKMSVGETLFVAVRVSVYLCMYVCVYVCRGCPSWRLGDGFCDCLSMCVYMHVRV
jgi:hypothetical protein